mmetsp:Transcript_23643/g.45919  ORF Transcript_23643/g.45919 Transcript_23643/m.45919 type:complete len:664 (-) Transcript_23643:236-2227(-)|eukprot:CAMPEP_0173411208 /NCGR_PEP_ID=MMETSP1356-20130122/76392_1 /TAXON_ID=77927 ORGANISM="Hemiselmis virescens, Strain PCC157" /NCGR_SAMPLE_ID=MMETSP1356 /ASSEMBLY_ACC=CAM_ASM_000847 /LENGTH=663 /DNA_ID=CAMNT_0014372935 /DNA_START=232 /DNA_END=2223 /DNA_ORIENTATION=+
MQVHHKPVGPTGPAHLHALPMGTFPARGTMGAFGDLHGDTLMAQPAEPSMPLRPRLAPGTPVQAMTVHDPNAAGGKHPFVVILSKQQATDIYMMRSPETTSDPALKAVAGKSSMVAEMYRVSPKTIRDIWNRKTWTQVTRASWTPEEAEEYAQEQALAKLPPSERAALKDELKKRRGRPPGSKDTRPRRRRLKAGEEGSEHSEGVMYVTTDAGAVEVRPIPAAPRTSDSVEHPVRNASPVRRAPPFDARANGMKALRAFELGNKSTPGAAKSSFTRSHSFDSPSPASESSPETPVKALTFTGRSQSFDMAPSSNNEVAPAPYLTPLAPRAAPGAGLCEDYAESATFEPYTTSAPSINAASHWGSEESSCNAEPGCADDSGYCPMPGSGTPLMAEEDPDFKPQLLLGPVDDQLDLLHSPAVGAFVPPVHYWEEKAALDEEHRRHMERLSQLEQEFEHRKQRHQAQFAETHSAFQFAAQQHNRLYANTCGAAVACALLASPAPVQGAAPKISPIVAPSQAPAVAKMPQQEQGHVQPAAPSQSADAPEHSAIMGEWSNGQTHASSTEASCDFGWFPGSSEQSGAPELQREVSTRSDGGDWHAPFFGAEHGVKHLIGDSPQISHVGGRSGMSHLEHQGSHEAWWSQEAAGLGSGTWRAETLGIHAGR